MDQKLSSELRAEAAEDLGAILQDWGGVYSDADQMQMDADFFAEEDAAELARDGGY